MNEKLAMDLFESGAAFGVSVHVILMEADGVVYFSVDGHAWHRSDHAALKECLDAAKKLPGKDD